MNENETVIVQMKSELENNGREIKKHDVHL